MKKFVHLNDLGDLQVPDRKNVDGRRVYVTPKGDYYPSITSILGSQPKPGIDQWKAKVGEKEANRIIKESTKIGTAVHTLCEDYLLNKNLYCDDKEVLSVFNRLRFMLGNIDNIYGLEIPLYSDILRVAGTADCIADWNGVLSVIDFKTSRKAKREDWIQDYYTQAFFYSAAFFEMTGALPEQVVILVAVRDSFEVQVFKKNHNEMDIYMEKLINIMKTEPYVVQQH